jgi:hypothetical protein
MKEYSSQTMKIRRGFAVVASKIRRLADQTATPEALPAIKAKGWESVTQSYKAC